LEIPIAQPNELTGVVHRDRFDDLPGDVTDPIDIQRWINFRAAYHRAQNLEEFTPFPLQLDFELTSQCNLRCAFCIHGHETVQKRELTFERFARAIDEGQKHGLCSIKLNYINEPLLIKDFAQYVKYAKAHGVLNIYFATNGVLLNERIREELIEARVSKIMISLDATTAETFEVMRRSTQFELIVRNIHALLARRNALGLTYPIVRVNFLKTPLNIHEAETFVAQWTNVADMIGLQDQVGLPGVENNLLLDEKYVDHSAFRCSFPFKMLVIDSAGHILPCCTFSGREMPLGHVDDMTLAEAWKSPTMLALKTSHQQGTWMSNSVCLNCVTGCA
jgi:radical SAM protein with 4Fe4S-binding SPASM domain